MALSRWLRGKRPLLELARVLKTCSTYPRVLTCRLHSTGIESLYGSAEHAPLHRSQFYGAPGNVCALLFFAQSVRGAIIAAELVEVVDQILRKMRIEIDEAEALAFP